MKTRSLYTVAPHIRLACRLLNISPDAVLQRVALPADYLETETHGVPATTYFSIWCAVAEVAEREDAALFLAREVARQPYLAPIIAFASSHDIRTGLERLAIFKPLSAPIQMRVSTTTDRVTISIRPAVAVTMPCQFGGWFDMVFLTELCRHYSGVEITPLAVQLPDPPPARSLYETFLGIDITPGDEVALTLSAEDAARPLLSENAELWQGYEPELRRQLREQQNGSSLAARVEAALLDLLPSGKVGADDVCAALALSRRSLQRRLHEEGQSFRSLRDRIRETMARRYLTRTEMTVTEISYLLAYRDPNSFYRAFQGWTGMTPGEARSRTD